MQMHPSFGGGYNQNSIRSLHMYQATSIRDQNISTVNQGDHGNNYGYSNIGKTSLQSLLPMFPPGQSNMDSIVHVAQNSNH